MIQWIVKIIHAPLLQFFDVLCCLCSPESSLRGIVLQVGFLVQAPARCKVTWFRSPFNLTDHVMDIYDSQTYGLKTRVCIWTRIHVVPVYYGILFHKFHLVVWFFQSVTGI